MLFAGVAAALAADAAPLLERFETTYHRVLKLAGNGNLPPAAAQQALQLRTELEHALVEHRAEVEELKFRLKQASEIEQEALAERLVAAGAGRERVVMKHLERLEALLAGSAQVVPSGTAVVEGAEEPAKPEGRLQIRSVPEDLSRGEVE
jgi:hypothetical protein